MFIPEKKYVGSSRVYTLVVDPGHGWLQVPAKEIKELGIWDDISGYSYRSPDCPTGSGFVFLEEDCDLSRFVDAKQARGEDVPFSELYVKRSSRIRNYPRFK